MRHQDSPSRDGLARYLQLQTMRGLSLRPRILVISCCDFWGDPHVLTGTRPGEMLQIKTPGNIVPPLGAHPTSEAATIEMAITEFQVSDIIVVGHSPCRCMTNLMSPESLDSMMPSVSAWLEFAASTRQIVQNKYADRTAYAQIEAATEENVLVQLAHLKTHPSVATALALEKVNLHGWVYRADISELASFSPRLNRFVAAGGTGGGIDDYQ
jgi:carbonic anhydrase